MNIFLRVAGAISRRLSGALVRASMWTAVGFGVSQAIRLANNLLLTRLLAPEAFGLMAIVTVVIIGIEMLTDVGLSTVLIQSKQGESPDFVNTAWTVKIIRGIAIAIMVAALAGPLSSFYGETELRSVLYVIAASPLISGFSSNAVTLAARRFWLGRLTAITLISQISSSLFMLLWAYQSPTVWALVAGFLVNSVSFSFLSHFVFPRWRSRVAVDRASLLEILRFGRWIFVTSALVFAAGQLDRVILAKLVPLNVVAFYSIASLWAMLPVAAAQTWCNRIILPLASEIARGERPDSIRMISHRRYFIGMFSSAMCLFGFGFSIAFFQLYPPSYWPAYNFFPVLLGAGLIKLWDESYRVLNLAFGQPKFTTYGSAVGLLTFLATVFQLYRIYGAEGIAIAYALSQIGSLVVAAFGVYRLSLSDFKFDFCAGGLLTTISVGYYTLLIRQ